MKTILLALVVASAAAGHTFARERALTDSAVAGFSLLPAARCAEEYDPRQCQVAGPKDWSADDRLMMQQTLRRLSENELVRGLLVGAQDNGFGGFRRYSTDTRNDETGPVPKFSPGFVLFQSKAIGITDAFFQTADISDPLSGYRFGDLILIHELIHAFDDRKKSTDIGFTSLTAWVFRNNRWDYLNPVNFSEYHGVVAETLTLYGRGRYGEAWARDRSFATAMTFPLPTIQSLATPGESYADILAHLILDRSAPTYLKRNVVEWFEKNVFPALRDNARRFSAADYDIF